MGFQLIIGLAINQLTPRHAHLHTVNEFLSINLTLPQSTWAPDLFIATGNRSLQEKQRRAAGGKIEKRCS